MADINVASNTLEDATSYLIQYLRDSGFEGSTEAGTAIYDVLVRPAAILYMLFSDSVNRAKAYGSIAGADSVRTLIGETEYNSAIDAILQNWFVTRKEGNKSTGTVRLYFSRSFSTSYFEIVKDGVSKFSINGVNYDVARDYALSSSNFSNVYNSQRNAVEYYTDIEVETIDNVAATIGEVTSNLNSVYLLRATVQGNITSGKPFETSEEFIARTNQAITTRELISDNAIYTVLGEVFPGINELYIAGYGEVEQLRDIVVFEDVDIHVGNKADIYLNIDMEETTAECSVNSSGIVAVSSIGQHVADILKVSHTLQTEGKVRLYRATLPGGNVTVTTGIEFVLIGSSTVSYSPRYNETIHNIDWLPCYDPSTTGYYYDIILRSEIYTAAEEGMLLEVGTPFVVPTALTGLSSVVVGLDPFSYRSIDAFSFFVDKFNMGTVGNYPPCEINELISEVSTCYVTFLGKSTFTDVLNYVTDAANRVVCYDPVVKSKYLIYIGCEVTISTIGLSTSATIEAERVLCKNTIITYINGLKKDDVFSVYDMLVAINTTCTNIDRVKVPPTVTYRFQEPEFGNVYTGSITDYFSLEDVDTSPILLCPMVSSNTFQYYANPAVINVSIDKVTY